MHGGTRPDRAIEPPREPSVATTFDEVTSQNDTIYWIESGSETKPFLASWSADRGTLARSPGGVGNALHAYGGGAYVSGPDGVFATFETDGQVRDLRTGDALTRRHEHGDLSWGDGRLLCVRETETGDELVAVDTVLPRSRTLIGADFLASPRATTDRLAWVQWAADLMPWDASEVWVAEQRPDGSVRERRRVAGGFRESAYQPRWSPDGDLYFLSDRSGWWNLYRWDGDEVAAVAPMAAECGPAMWEAGYSTYAFLPGDRIGMIVQNGPLHRVVVVGPSGVVTDAAAPYVSIKPYLATVGDRLALAGASPDRAMEVALLTTDGSGRHTPVRSAAAPPVAPEHPAPEVMSVLLADGPVTAVVYRPTGGTSTVSPLLVRAHPGPTDNSELRPDRHVRFFTGRGFTVADVDYRGSTGYGRSFRTALNGRWGDCDVADCIGVARHLIQSGRADARATFISGASAGGYTALGAVGVPSSPFAAAVARSAIVDPARWADTAPRFQRAHARTLASRGGGMDPDRIARPVVLIHGLDDHVAPYDDVLDLATRLDRRGLLVQLVTLPGAGHVLRSVQDERAALSAELRAYERFLEPINQ